MGGEGPTMMGERCVGWRASVAWVLRLDAAVATARCARF